MKYFAVLLFALCSQATAANLRAIAPLLGVSGKSGPSSGYGPVIDMSDIDGGNIT